MKKLAVSLAIATVFISDANAAIIKNEELKNYKTVEKGCWWSVSKESCRDPLKFSSALNQCKKETIEKCLQEGCKEFPSYRDKSAPPLPKELDSEQTKEQIEIKCSKNSKLYRYIMRLKEIKEGCILINQENKCSDLKNFATALTECQKSEAANCLQQGCESFSYSNGKFLEDGVAILTPSEGPSLDKNTLINLITEGIKQKCAKESKLFQSFKIYESKDKLDQKNKEASE